MRSLILALVACGGSPSPSHFHAPKPPSPELSPALVPLDWWLGDWHGPHGDEHWIAASGAIYGIGLANDGTFEVMIVDDADGPGRPDGKLRFMAMPGGSGVTTFDQARLETNLVGFANPAHDFPKTIQYAATAAGLTAIAAGGDKTETFAWKPGSRTPAPELEDADRRFSTNTAARKIDGWVAGFAPDGGMLIKGKRIEGAAALTDAMKDVLASGMLAWQPIASGRRDKVGFTVGKATYTGSQPEDNWKSTYVTIWKQQPDGEWKVWFDTGRPVNE